MQASLCNNDVRVTMYLFAVVKVVHAYNTTAGRFFATGLVCACCIFGSLMHATSRHTENIR